MRPSPRLLVCFLLSSLAAPGLTQDAATAERPTGITSPQLDEELAEKVEKLVDRAMSRGPIAGLSLAVDRAGEVLLARGWGFANLELDVPATENTIYRIGSITKQFTAAAVCKLAERDELELDDPITDYFPEFPTHDHEVRLEHLLNHTSGIKSYTGQPAFWETAHKNLSHEEMIAQFSGLPYDFVPGQKFLYNNSAFYLLGAVIEKVSGQSYGDYLRDEVFRPLGMDSSCYGWNRPLLKGRASGYDAENGELLNCRFMGMAAPGAAGALCSTVLDLVRWNRGLYHGEVVSEDSLEAMTTSGKTDDGEEIGYGYGLAVGKAPDGSESVSHGGGIFGFSSFLLYLPGAELSVAVLTNTSGAAAGGVAQQVAAAVLAETERP